MELLLQYLNSIYPLSAAGIAQFSSLIKERELKKKDFLLRAGHICHNIYFIQQGLLRCYYLKADTEVCSWFMKEGDIIISVESFYHQVKSYESIQALEDCLVLYMSYTELKSIYSSFPEFNYVGRVLTEKYYCLSEQRLYSMRMMRSDERYRHLLEHHPELILRVPAKYIASYLGLSEAHLSVIKSRR
jgi:CRP/FNR family transcriptional regulator, anaerobic regulatory protein